LRGRCVAALGAAERQTAELFDPEGRVFGYSEASMAPQQRTLSSGMLRCNYPTFFCSWMPACAGMTSNGDTWGTYFKTSIGLIHLSHSPPG